VTTTDVVRYSYFIDSLVSNHKPLLLVGALAEIHMVLVIGLGSPLELLDVCLGLAVNGLLKKMCKATKRASADC